MTLIERRILDLTRAALKDLIDNEFVYLHLLAAIEEEAAAPQTEPMELREASNTDEHKSY